MDDAQAQKSSESNKDYILRKRKEWFDAQWEDMSNEERQGLRDILIFGRPEGVAETVWMKLRARHFCDGPHFYDAGGIRQEFADLIAEKFRA